MVIYEYLPWILPGLVTLLVLCVHTRKLTIGASLMAGAIGLLVLQGAGLGGACMLLTFFGLSVFATSHGKVLKRNIQPVQTDDEGRNSAQVFANGGLAGILSLLAILLPTYSDLFILMLAASLASALADTLSSELGMVYGRRFFNIISFREEAKGLDGVVSIEGTLIGLAGAVIIAVIHSRDIDKVITVAVAGIFGNFMDSVLGALFERKQVIGNNAVNFLNTLFAALFALLMNELIK